MAYTKEGPFVLTAGHGRLLFETNFVSSCIGLIQQSALDPYGTGNDVYCDLYYFYFDREWEYDEGEMDLALVSFLDMVRCDAAVAHEILLASARYGFEFKPGNYYRPDENEPKRWFPVGATNTWADSRDVWGDE